MDSYLRTTFCAWPDYTERMGLAGGLRFVREAGLAETASALTDVIVNRHRDVQHGKFDRGRRKLPWVEQRGSTIAITSSRVGGADRALESPAQVPLHAWRTYSARAFIAAVGGVS